MISKQQFQYLFKTVCTGVIALTVLSTLLISSPASAKSTQPELQTLEAFVESVRTGDGSALTGVFVRDVMAFSIVKQPEGSPDFVSYQDGVFTQFSMASQVGSNGLLAHNFLAGRFLNQIPAGTEIVLVYGDGRLEYYRVTNILQYQALDSSNPYSDFRDLSSNTTISAGDLFNLVYASSGRLVLQTCIAQNDDLSWGRLFIVAEPESFQAVNAFAPK